VGGRARSLGGESIVALTRRNVKICLSRPRDALASRLRSRHDSSWAVNLHIPASDPDVARPRPRILEVSPFVLEVAPSAADRTSPGCSAGRNVAVLAGGAVIPTPPAPHTRGSGGSPQVGRRDDPQAAFGRLACGERLANPAPLFMDNPMTRRIK
jgi:hypothetical protein